MILTTEDHKFIASLKENDLDGVRAIPKADKHCHMDLGGDFIRFAKQLEKPLKSPPSTFPAFAVFQDYILDELDPLLSTIVGTKFAKLQTILQAKVDGIQLLEASMDDGFSYHFSACPSELIDYLNGSIATHHPTLDFRPELGLGRTDDVSALAEIAQFNIDTGYFKSIDLYGAEMGDRPEKYQEIFKYAKRAGLKLKAHVGEYGDAESIRHTITTLELDEVQHGIQAYTSKEVMNWLAAREIPLHICPVSNVKLQVVAGLETHPIRILYDHGVKVTINTDDTLIFGSSLSEVYLQLHSLGVFSAVELNEIRLNGLQVEG